MARDLGLIRLVLLLSTVLGIGLSFLMGAHAVEYRLIEYSIWLLLGFKTQFLPISKTRSRSE